MRGIGALTLLGFAATLAACGGTNNSARTPALRWVLTSDAERLEFEPQPLLADLFNEAVRSSRTEAASSTKSTAPFLIIENGREIDFHIGTPKADIPLHGGKVVRSTAQFGPGPLLVESDIGDLRHLLLNDLVGRGQQRFRDGEAEGLGGHLSGI